VQRRGFPSVAKLDFLTAARDPGFDAQVQSSGAVYAIARQPDGKVIVGGDFWFAGGLPRQNLARINPDGTLDPFWSPDPDGIVNAIAVEGTSVFVGGIFHRHSGLP